MKSIGAGIMGMLAAFIFFCMTFAKLITGSDLSMYDMMYGFGSIMSLMLFAIFAELSSK